MSVEQNATGTNEMTLTDIVLTGNRFVRESLRKWYIYLIAFLIVGGYMFYTAFTEPITYQATVTLMRDDDESSGVSGVASIIGPVWIWPPLIV